MSGLLQRFKISSDTTRNLALALGLPFDWDSHGATHYRVVRDEKEGDRIDFDYKATEKDGWIALPFPLDNAEKLTSFVAAWLEHAKYGECPDTDGSASKGWFVYKEEWNIFVSVRAEYIVYGK